MIKFGKTLAEYERRIIEFERKRIILYLSKLNHQEIWDNVRHKEENIIINGIVKSIINGAVKKNKHFILGGKFKIDTDFYYLIEDIFAISFTPFSLEDKDFKKGWGDSFSSSILGDEAESRSDIMFSWTDLKPQDFNDNTISDQSSMFTGEFRKFNTRYYEIIADTLNKLS